MKIKELADKAGIKFIYLREMEDFSELDRQMKEQFEKTKETNVALGYIVACMFFGIEPDKNSQDLSHQLKDLASHGKIKPQVCGKIVKTLSIVYQCEDCKIHP